MNTPPDYLHHYTRSVGRALDATEVTAKGQGALPVEQGLARATELSRQAIGARKTMFFCGNGASSAMAGHMALDWLKAGEAKAVSFNDPAVLTAVANDTGYENAFSLPLSRLGSAGDVLVTISSSGNSPNVLAAIPAAQRLGMTVLTFSGFKPDNRSRQLGDLNFYVPCKTYGVAECCHQVLLHAWLDHYLGIVESWA